MPCGVVCISHATGAGGAAVGRLVAERLGFLFVDEEIVAGAAARGGLATADVTDEEKRRTLATRILDLLASSGGEALTIAGAVPLPVPDRPPSDEVRELIRETIRQTVARGRVVISAHAASHAVDGRPDVLRVLVTASTSTRERRVGEEQGIGGPQAVRLVKHADAARRDYLERFYDVDHELPTHYDLVLNTDVLTVEDAADVVARAASR